MSRRSKNSSGSMIPGIGSFPYSQENSGSGGGGGSKAPYGTLNLQFGKKGITVTGNNIQTVTVPIKAKQQPQQGQQQQGQQGPWPGNSGGGPGVNGQAILSTCILAATQLAQIAEQEFTLHQQAHSANRSLLTALTQMQEAVGMSPMTKKQRKAYVAPQQQVQQNQQRGRNRQRQQNQQFVTAGS